MQRLFRWLTLAALLAAVPAVAQEKGAPKAGDKKPDEKKESPFAKHAAKYQIIRTITIRIGEIDPKEMTIKFDTGRPGQTETYTIVDDVIVRRSKLPDRRDEKNRPLPYTAQERAKLRGNDQRVPGYEAELSAVTKGQTVDLELSATKLAPGAAKKKGEPEKPFVTRIVITADEPKTPEKKK